MLNKSLDVKHLNAIESYFGAGAVLQVLLTACNLQKKQLNSKPNNILSEIIYKIISDKLRHQSQTISPLISYATYLKFFGEIK